MSRTERRAGAFERRLARAAGLLVLVVLLAAAAAPRARAGEWVQVSCVNPSGTAAPSQGWGPGQTYAGDGALNTQCGPNAPMSAKLLMPTPAAVGAFEVLMYTPPSGSTLEGGKVSFGLWADGSGSGEGQAFIAGPTINPPYLVYCSYGHPACYGSGNDYPQTTYTLPASAGGGFYAVAGCGGTPNEGETCSQGGSDQAWAEADVYWADMLLSNSSTPAASGFGGSLLGGDAQGTAGLLFTATDPSGPGVYQVTVQIDGRTVYQGTPNANGGACAPVGTDTASGALMFDFQQPCPQSETVNIPVPTTGFANGQHDLAVSVTDAAGNSASVLNDEITIDNPRQVQTPRPKHGIRAHFTAVFHYHGARITFERITPHALPRAATVRLACHAPRHHRRWCPRLAISRARGRRIARMLRDLRGRTFHAGASLTITISARHRRSERILVVFHRRRVTSRLLGR